MREPSSPIPDEIPNPQEENEYDTPCGSQLPNRNTEQHGDQMPYFKMVNSYLVWILVCLKVQQYLLQSCI